MVQKLFLVAFDLFQISSLRLRGKMTSIKDHTSSPVHITTEEGPHSDKHGLPPCLVYTWKELTSTFISFVKGISRYKHCPISCMLDLPESLTISSYVT
jgi:hypothetical protein